MMIAEFDVRARCRPVAAPPQARALNQIRTSIVRRGARRRRRRDVGRHHARELAARIGAVRPLSRRDGVPVENRLAP